MFVRNPAKQETARWSMRLQASLGTGNHPRHVNETLHFVAQYLVSNDSPPCFVLFFPFHICNKDFESLNTYCLESFESQIYIEQEK